MIKPALKPTILIADNQENFLNSCAANVRSAGYRVVLAKTPHEARDAITKGDIHVAVIDVRMTDDKDELDFSGRDLALEIPSCIGIVLMSNVMTRELMDDTNRELITRNQHCEYVFKLERGAADKLIKSIQGLLTHQVRINFGLNWISAPSKALSPLSLAQILFSITDAQDTLDKANELEGVFRRLFVDCESIRVLEILWVEDMATAVLCRVARGLETRTHAVFVSRQLPQDSQSAIQNGHPERALGMVRLNVTRSVHFLAWSAETDMDLEGLIRLDDLARQGNKRLRQVLSHLFEARLSGLRRKQPLISTSSISSISISDNLLAQACEKQLHWPNQTQLIQQISAQVDSLLAVLANFGWRIQRTQDELIFTLGGKRHVFADPVMVVESLLEESAIADYEFDYSPGRLTTDKIYADASNHAWLLVPAAIDAVPKAWDLAATEASIRFDLTPKLESAHLEFVQNISDQFEVERKLIWYPDRGLKTLAGKGPTQNHSVLMEGVESIRAIAEETGVDARTYFQSLFMHLVQRWLTVETILLPHREAIWAGYALLATSMLGTALFSAMPLNDELPQPPYSGPTFEIANPVTNEIRVRGEPRTLTPTSFRLFEYLLKHVGEICKREAILEAVYGTTWDQASQALTTEACRLRDTIEPRRKGSRPIYLETIRGTGYKLIDPAAIGNL